MAMTSRSNVGRETPNKKGRGNIHNARVTPGDTPPRQLNRVRQKKRASPIHNSLKTRRRTLKTSTKKGRASETIMSSDEESSNKENDEEEHNQGKNDDQDDYYGDSTNQLEQVSGRDVDDYSKMQTINDKLISRIMALSRVIDKEVKIIASKEKLEKELYKQIDKQGDKLRLEWIEKKKLFNSTTIESAKNIYHDKDLLTPSLTEMLALRQEPVWDRDDKHQMTNNQRFLFLVTYMYGSIIGKRQWNKDKFNKKTSEEMTTSDEAFVLLVIENNWHILNEVEDAEPMYTSKGSTSNRRNDGWTNEGIMRYNELVAYMKKNRKETFSYKVEEEVMKVLYEKGENGTNARRKRDATQDDDTTNGKSGSNTKKKKKHATEENHTIPIIDLDSSDGND
eukprot:scaffold10196_cov51-Attheya_sp.AAC.1